MGKNAKKTRKSRKKVGFPRKMAKKSGGGTPTLVLRKVPVHLYARYSPVYDIILRIISR